MDQTKLATFVADRLKNGMKAEDIKQNMLLVGWSEEEAGAALVAGLVSSGVPSPERVRLGQGRLTSTVEVILNLFSFILLGTVAWALGDLYYQIINKYFPDLLNVGYGYSDVTTSTIHYAIATLIIAFPIYVLTVRMWFTRYREDEAKVESKLTKWLTYLVLLVTAITIVGDLIAALFYFLQGEVTMRFFLKALTILIISGLIFGFYYLERKKIQYKNDIPQRTFHLFGWAVTALILLAIIIGFFAGGSPATERKRGFDQQRASDLNSLTSCIGNYASEHKALPDSLEKLVQTSSYSYCANLKDPEMGTPYEYRIVNPSTTVGQVLEGTFELCANFSLDAAQENLQNNTYNYYPANGKWAKHTAGHSCNTEVVTFAPVTYNQNPSVKPVPLPPTPIPG